MRHAIDLLDKTERTIPSTYCRSACGFPQDQAWSRYRRNVGISGKKKFLTIYESVMLLIRKDWRQVCRDLGWKYVSDPSPTTIDKAARTLVDRKMHATLFRRTRSLAAIASPGNKEWEEVLDLVEGALGKRLSERTIRRICKENPNLPAFSRLRLYSSEEVQAIIEAAQH